MFLQLKNPIHWQRKYIIISELGTDFTENLYNYDDF